MVDSTVCMNIGRGQRRVRYAASAGFGLIAVVLALALIASGASHWWRLIVVVPAYLAVVSYTEAATRICVRLANRDEQSLDDKIIISKTTHGDEIQDNALKTALRQLARVIFLQSVGIAIALTALFLVIPR